MRDPLTANPPSEPTIHQAMKEATTPHNLRLIIREVFVEAQELERPPYNLTGRGHEDRVSLDRTLSAILRGTEITRLYIPGFGPKYWYPARVVKTAAKIINRRVGKAVIKFYGTCAYSDTD